MKKGDMKLITLPNGEKIESKFLGSGSFALCFEHEGFVYSFVKFGRKDSDYSKEAIALWAEENPYIPQFESLGNFGDDEGICYKSPLYNPLTKENKQAWEEFKILKSSWLKYEEIKKCYCPADENEKQIDKLRGRLSDLLISALESINNSCRNYGDSYKFEFPKGNLKIDSNGHLILLDIIFNVEALREKKPNKFKS